MKELVSIITPVYNCEQYIKETIESVLGQTYTNWEMLLIDDCTPDGSPEIIKDYSKKDKRIRYIKLPENSGAAVARNKGLSEAHGRYIAYLDADDLWHKDKLERQIAFMTQNNVAFTCCDYEVITSDGGSLNKFVSMPSTISYDGLLRNTIIQTVGVIVDTKFVKHDLLKMPLVRRGQDMATWLNMLKNGVEFYGQNEVLAKYRRVENSLSSNKLKAVKRTWKLYREVEKLPLLKSVWCFVGYAYHASLKRIYPDKNKKRA